MINCCSNNLGRFVHNKEINTGIMVSELGNYILRLRSSDNNTFELIRKIETPDTIRISVGELNENMIYTFTLENPSGNLVKLNDCENFKLQTILNTQINGCVNPCNDSDDTSNYYN